MQQSITGSVKSEVTIKIYERLNTQSVHVSKSNGPSTEIIKSFILVICLFHTICASNSISAEDFNQI